MFQIILKKHFNLIRVVNKMIVQETFAQENGDQNRRFRSPLLLETNHYLMM